MHPRDLDLLRQIAREARARAETVVGDTLEANARRANLSIVSAKAGEVLARHLLADDAAFDALIERLKQ